ncbi:MAG: RluA family pseudouridine synthase [Candidatus Omnitrophica bacterium]|nr:RluA family pseudouridine synthase [Candidatus Omnitrophota bacterium]
MQEYKISVSEEDKGKRLDVFILEFAKKNSLGLSRTSLQKLMEEGCLYAFESCSTGLKPHYKIKPGDSFILRIPEVKPRELKPENIPLDIVYEDSDLAVINKPSGLVVHPAPGNYEHTLVNALLYHFKELSSNNPLRPGIVHRLDKDTSGLMLIAKNNQSHLYLAEQFSRHGIKRKYVALVKGRVEFDEDVIDLPIARHPVKRQSMAVGFGANSRYAKTHYRTLKRTDVASLLELEPFTGRTHQLRVHLAHIDHPILGDTKYGKNNPPIRLALHAFYIGFRHPTKGQFLEFSTPIPKEFTEFLRRIKIP